MKSVMLSIIFVVIGFVVGLCYERDSQKIEQQETTYTQQEVDEIITLLLQEVDQCDQELYNLETDLIECQSVCVKCVIKLVQTKMKGASHGLSRYFKFSSQIK